MLPTTITPISGHHRSGSLSQSQEHQHARDNHPNHQLDDSQLPFDTRGRPVPGVCLVTSQIFRRSHRSRAYSINALKVIQPARNKPTDDEFFTYDLAGEKKPDHEFLKSHFFCEGRLTEDQALYILEHATKIFSTEPNMVPVKSPVTSA
jgi:hypothetical protein